MEKLSIVVPVYNEEETLSELTARIYEVSAEHSYQTEIIFVDDGSTDSSFEVIKQLSEEHKWVKGIKLASNGGKASALALGFKYAAGNIIFSLDADLQDDPKEIPRFVDAINQGYDMVSGWKKKRHDPWHKTIPSRFFNFTISRLFKMRLHDFNCGYKAYKPGVAKQLCLYGELHRYIPVFAKYMGARIKELPVEHHARKFGQSKYGAERLVKGFLDMVTVLMITRFLKRPLHILGTLGVIFSTLGILCMSYLAMLWVAGCRPIGNRPLLLYGIAMLIVGVQLFSLGVVAELFIRFNHASVTTIIAQRVGFADEE